MAQFNLPAPLTFIDRTHVLEGRRRLSYFGGCDYFRLTWHPKVRGALRRGVSRGGIHPAASRKTTGNHRWYEELEEALRDYFSVPAAVLVSNGYATNQAVGQAMAGRFTHVLIDRMAHASLQDAAPVFGAARITFSHRDPADLKRRCLLAGRSARIIILTDGMFAHDGSVAPLDAYRCAAPPGTWLLVDDAHGAGVLGEKGRGSPEHLHVDSTRLIQTISLSKSFGCYGGAILGSRDVCAKVVSRSNVFVGNTPLPLPLVMASLTALKLVREHPEWRQQLQSHMKRIQDALGQGPSRISAGPGPVVGFVVRSVKEVAGWKTVLRERGVFPSYLRYSRQFRHGMFRFAISHRHTSAQIEALICALQSGRKR